MCPLLSAIYSTLLLLIALFKNSRFVCCSTPSFGVSIVSAKKTHHCLIYFQHQPLLLLNVCVCVCVFISFHRKGFSWLKQNNKYNARDQASDVMLRKLLSVQYFHYHVIDNLSRDPQASNCVRVSIKPGWATRNKRQLLKLSENQR